jgi:hypothetical protein
MAKECAVTAMRLMAISNLHLNVISLANNGSNWLEIKIYYFNSKPSSVF